MPFSNPIVGGSKLIRAAIQSPNYVAGTSGWTINRDGTAEFAQATIRGNVVIVGNTTSGNIEIASSGGYATIKFYNIAHTDFAQISTQDISGSPQLVIAGGVRPSTIGPGNPNVRPVIKQDPTVFAQFIGAADNLSGTPVLGNQIMVSDTQVVMMEVDSTNTLQSSFGVSNSGLVFTHDFPSPANIGGFQYETNTVPTVDYFTQSGWGAWNNLTLLNGWSNLGGNWSTAQYRMDCEGRVELKGVIIGGTKADGTNIFTLPIPFRPQKDEILPVAMISAGAAANVNVRVFSATGQVQCFGMGPSANGNHSLGSTTFTVRP